MATSTPIASSPILIGSESEPSMLSSANQSVIEVRSSGTSVSEFTDFATSDGTYESGTSVSMDLSAANEFGHFKPPKTVQIARIVGHKVNLDNSYEFIVVDVQGNMYELTAENMDLASQALATVYCKAHGIDDHWIF